MLDGVIRGTTTRWILADEWARADDACDRDEHDPRDGLMRDLDLPRDDERELVEWATKRSRFTVAYAIVDEAMQREAAAHLDAWGRRRHRRLRKAKSNTFTPRRGLADAVA